MKEEAWAFTCKRCNEQHFLQKDAFNPETMKDINGVGCLCDRLYFANYAKGELEPVAVEAAELSEGMVECRKVVPRK